MLTAEYSVRTVHSLTLASHRSRPPQGPVRAAPPVRLAGVPRRRHQVDGAPHAQPAAQGGQSGPAGPRRPRRHPHRLAQPARREEEKSVPPLAQGKVGLRREEGRGKREKVTPCFVYPETAVADWR